MGLGRGVGVGAGLPPPACCPVHIVCVTEFTDAGLTERAEATLFCARGTNHIVTANIVIVFRKVVIFISPWERLVRYVNAPRGAIILFVLPRTA